MPIYLSLGSNIGERQRNIQKALRLLKEKSFTISKVSSLYETSPWGKKNQPYFLNLVIEGETDLLPEMLLEKIKRIENEMGRVEKKRWRARIIDIDILFYNQEIIDTPSLKIPHLQLHRRAFVLIPLNEIAPGFIHPILNKSVKDMLQNLDDKGKVLKYKGVFNPRRLWACP